ncbi:MAG: hypothetical protein H0U75_04720 [Legionella sp.]|nr:hypothetical protein [Legionella sp.]
MALPSLSTFISRGIGPFSGLIIGLVSSPFSAFMYTYQTSKQKGWNIPFVVSISTFPFRLLLNLLMFPFISMAGGVFHGAKSGFMSGLFWPRNFLRIINDPMQNSHLLRSMFISASALPTSGPNLLAPAPIPAMSLTIPSISPLTALSPSRPPLIPNLLSPVPGITAENKENKEEKEEKTQDVGEKFLRLEEQLFNWPLPQLQQFAFKLKNEKYTALSLCNQQFALLTPETITLLMQCISNSEINILWLNNSNIGLLTEEQLKAFGEGLANSKLKTLYLYGNNFDNLTPPLMNLLMRYISKSSIETLDLGMNNLSKFTSHELNMFLGENLKRSSVKNLFLNQNSLEKLIFRDLVGFLSMIKTIRNLNLSNNFLCTATNLWNEKAIIYFMTELQHVSMITLINTGFTPEKRAIFTSFSTDRNAKQQRLAFLMGSKPKLGLTDPEVKSEVRPRNMYDFFFNDALGGQAASYLTKEIFSFVGSTELDFGY